MSRSKNTFRRADEDDDQPLLAHRLQTRPDKRVLARGARINLRLASIEHAKRVHARHADDLTPTCRSHQNRSGQDAVCIRCLRPIAASWRHSVHEIFPGHPGFGFYPKRNRHLELRTEDLPLVVDEGFLRALTTLFPVHRLEIA